LRVLLVFLSTLGLWAIGGSEGPSGHRDLGPSGGGGRDLGRVSDRGDCEMYAVYVVR
jgi:hypothetical protein